MAITIVHEPRELCAAKNPILYRLQTDSESTQFFLCKIYMESELYADDFTNIFPDDGTAEAKPHPETLEADFDLSRYILEFLEQDFDTHDLELPDVQKKKFLTRRFYVEFAEFVSSEGTFTARPQRFVILAGFDVPGFATRGWQTMPNNSYILSTAPIAPRILNTAQHCPVYFLPRDGGSQTIKITVNYINDTKTQTIINATAKKYEPFALNFGFEARNYSNATNIQDIEIDFNDEKINIIPHKAELCIEYREFMYLNSLGGLDSFLAEGEFINEVDISQDVFLRFVPNDYNETQMRAVDNYNSNYNMIFTINSGYIPLAQRKSLIDFLISEKRWVLENGKMIPITLISPKMPKDSNQEFLKSVVFSYKYAFDQKNYEK